MPKQTPQRKKLYLLADELTLNRIERLDVACYLLRRDITSFDSLDDDQVLRMLDAFEGTLLVLEQYRQRVRILEATSTTAPEEQLERSDEEDSSSGPLPNDDAG